MKNKFMILFFGLMSAFVASAADKLPSPSLEPTHPGSKIYQYEFTESTVTCLGRSVSVFKPKSQQSELFPVVIYGHGQAMGVDNDRASFEHLAKKGIAVIWPTYDKGFFDQEWQRMAQDYIAMSECAIKENPTLDSNKVIFAGYSKGGYVASIAAGLANKNNSNIRPKAALLFSPAGHDNATLAQMDSQLVLTVVRAEEDQTVKPAEAIAIYQKSSAIKKQLIVLKSYRDTDPVLTADHFWTLSKGSFMGGKGESAFHYFGLWKWIGGAAFDLNSGGPVTNEFIYGGRTLEKGLRDLKDERQATF